MLLHLFLHTGRLLDERVRAALRAHGAHHGQGRVLDALLEHGALPLSKLAAGLHIAQPTATVMVQRMEAQGLVERRTVSKDARLVEIALTARGRRAAHGVRAAWQDVEQSLRGGIPPGRHEDLESLLLAVRDHLGGKSPAFDEESNESSEEEPCCHDEVPVRRPHRRR